MSSVRRHLMFAATLAIATVASTGLGWAQQPAKPATPAATAKPAAAARPASTTTGSVKGRVMHGNDGLPYANVTVLGTQMGTMTDENGNFVIRGRAGRQPSSSRPRRSATRPRSRPSRSTPASAPP